MSRKVDFRVGQRQLENRRDTDNNHHTDVHTNRTKSVLPLMKTPARLQALAWRACLWIALGCATLAFVVQPTRADVTEAWVQRSSILVSNSQDLAYKVVRDPAGDIIVTGSSDNGSSGRDMLTIKYSGMDGSVLWQTRFNGPANLQDIPTALAVDPTGNVVVTGYSFFTNSNYDIYTAKYAAADGTLLWEHRYSGPANGNDGATAVAVDATGDVLITGYSYNGTNNDYYTAKYEAADGAVVWERRYNGTANNEDSPVALALDGVGNVVVTGSSNNGTNGDFYTAKYAAASGALLWERRYNGPADGYDGATALALDGSGNVIVTGYTSDNGPADYYTAKYAAADGALLWERTFNSPGNAQDVPHALAVDGSGNVIVTGSSEGFGTSSDYYTAKYAAADGALLWEQRYNGPANGGESPYGMALDGSGNVVVTGSSSGGSTSTGGTGTDFYTAKYAAADGTLLWEQTYNSPGNGEDTATALAVDGSGNVIVTGSSRGLYLVGGNSASDYYTAKYAAADGAVLWEQRYNGPSDGDSHASAVAVDSSGNVVVAGYYDGGNPFFSGTSYDFYTAKYAGTNGALLWKRTYNGPANADDRLVAMALDSNGNVVVTGSSYNGSNKDFYTAKYAAADGAILWEQSYNGPDNYDDQPSAIAVDASGNVFVTGRSFNGSPFDSYRGIAGYYTAKYAAADGALLWEKRYGNPQQDDANPVAMAVDASGNVVVSGYLFTYSATAGWLGADYYTVKYAAADGAVLWQKRSASGDSAPTALALDASGNVVVTGSSSGGFYTVKYAAENGALLWQKRYSSPAKEGDYPTAVAVDSSGNVLVTGYSSNYGANYGVDIYTAKYAAANGVLLWQRTFRTVDNEQAFAVKVDKSDNVVVAGHASNGTNYDYFTACYAATDGAVLWDKRYNGPANGDDVTYSSTLALGPQGMVVVAGSSSVNSRYGSIRSIATVVYREPLPPLAIAMVPTGVRLRFTGVAGNSYNIERAPAVSGPWNKIATPTAALDGLIEFVDTNAPPGAAFYRTSAP